MAASDHTRTLPGSRRFHRMARAMGTPKASWLGRKAVRPAIPLPVELSELGPLERRALRQIVATADLLGFDGQGLAIIAAAIAPELIDELAAFEAESEDLEDDDPGGCDAKDDLLIGSPLFHHVSDDEDLEPDADGEPDDPPEYAVQLAETAAPLPGRPEPNARENCLLDIAAVDAVRAAFRARGRHTGKGLDSEIAAQRFARDACRRRGLPGCAPKRPWLWC